MLIAQHDAQICDLSNQISVTSDVTGRGCQPRGAPHPAGAGLRAEAAATRRPLEVVLLLLLGPAAETAVERAVDLAAVLGDPHRVDGDVAAVVRAAGWRASRTARDRLEHNLGDENTLKYRVQAG